MERKEKNKGRKKTTKIKGEKNRGDENKIGKVGVVVGWRQFS